MRHVKAVDELGPADLGVVVGVGFVEFIVSMWVGQFCVAIVAVHIARLNGVVPQVFMLANDVIA